MFYHAGASLWVENKYFLYLIFKRISDQVFLSLLRSFPEKMSFFRFDLFGFTKPEILISTSNNDWLISVTFLSFYCIKVTVYFTSILRFQKDKETCPGYHGKPKSQVLEPRQREKNLCSFFLSKYGVSIACDRQFALGYRCRPLWVCLDVSWPTWRFASACNSSYLLTGGVITYLVLAFA